MSSSVPKPRSCHSSTFVACDLLLTSISSATSSSHIKSRDMMILVLITTLASSAQAVNTTGFCRYDSATPSPSGIDKEFCSSFITEHCATVTSLDPGRVTAYCECILESTSETATPAGNGTQIKITTTASRDGSQAPSTPTLSPQLSSLEVSRSWTTSSLLLTITSSSSIGSTGPTQLSSSSVTNGLSTGSLNATFTSAVTEGVPPSLSRKPTGNDVSSSVRNDTVSTSSATYTSLSGANVTTTEWPVSAPGNITATPGQVTSTSSASYNVSELPISNPSPSAASTWHGWNTTASSGQVVSPSNPTASPGTWPSHNGTLSTGGLLSPTSGNDTRAPSGTAPTVPSTEPFNPETLSITGSATTVGISEPTASATPDLSQLSSSGVFWNTSGSYPHTATTASIFSAANFTGGTRTAALAQETCYPTARDIQQDTHRRALMRNARLREQNISIPLPYVESMNLDGEGVDPLYLTIRDTSGGTHFLEIANKSQIALVRLDGTSMKVDAEGIFFTMQDCRYAISIIVDNFLEQLAALSEVDCSTGGRLEKRLLDLPFTQILVLKDQCANPVGRRIRDYPRLSVGSSECIDVSVDDRSGTWEFDCTFPGSESETLRCEAAIKDDVVDFLTTDPFGGACPDLATLITALSTTGKDFLSEASLRDELFKQDLNDAEEIEALDTLESYLQLWRVLQELFTKTDFGNNALERYLELYNAHRSFATDICEDIHADEIPLEVTLRAGNSRFIITTLNFAPESTDPREVMVQDPASIACCTHGSVAYTEGSGANNTCRYPAEAFIAGSGCVCGRTAAGDSLAFEQTECSNFVSRCESDQDCANEGHSGFICLTGTCCGGDVCIDPYACSENGTQLVTYEHDRYWRH